MKVEKFSGLKRTARCLSSLSCFSGRLYLSLLLFLLPAAAAPGGNSNFSPPVIAGIKVETGKTVVILNEKKIKNALAFRFADGRLVVGSGDQTRWSYDNGETWQSGPACQFEKASIDLGKGEILSIGRNSKILPDGKFSLQIDRSLDNWKTVSREEALLDIPNASYTVTGSGNRVDGFLFHHGILQLPNGDLIGSMYGNFEGDEMLCDGYPAELGQRKYHTIVVFSSDRGRHWGNPVQVAYDKMLGRGIPADHEMVGKSIPASRVSRTTIVPAVTQEGFRESDLVRAENGNLICLMRSGGRNPVPEANLFPTPLYCSRSSDEGKTWSPPAQIADRGVCPNAVTLHNGIIVCTYSRPGNWLIFSDDHGKTWKGAFQFGTGNATNYIEEVAPDTIQVYYEVKDSGSEKVCGAFFSVKRSK